MVGCVPEPNAGVEDPKAGAAALGEPKAPGVAGVPNAGVLAAPKPLPKAVFALPNAVLVAPNVGVGGGCAPNGGVDAAPNAGCAQKGPPRR
jgi:hypothetical protein